MRVFLIDDENVYAKMLRPVLKKAGHVLGYVSSGESALKKIASFNPDVIVLDIRLPDMSGFDVFSRLLNDEHFSTIPVIFVTSYNELESKLKAFELGAEDYLTKPFVPEELLARLEILARRREYLKLAETKIRSKQKSSHVIAVHSLRGGVGCTSLAINLAIANYQLWQKPTLVIDAVLVSGQVALFMNTSPKSTWKEFSDKGVEDIDYYMVNNLVNLHKSGIRYIASPSLPVPFEKLNDVYPVTIEELRGQYDTIIIDTPHDFSDIAVMSLDAADKILLLIAPEIGSLRAAICAIKTYDNLGYAPDKISIVLNSTNQLTTLKEQQIEKSLGHRIDFQLPFSAVVVKAINSGEPFLTSDSSLPISTRVEDLAYAISREELKIVPPATPTSTWKSVTKRINEVKSNNE